jgi:predicted negative regulator of RcsB-dependent stress response
MVILIPAFAFMFLITKKPSIKEILITLLLILTGLGLYVFLPLMAINTPEKYHWGDPTTISGFIEIVTGKIYGWHEATERTGITHTFKQLELYGKFMIKEFNYFGILLGISGCIFLAGKHLKIFIFTLIIYITNVFLVSYLISTEIEIFLEAILPGFFLPSHLIFSIWAGYTVFEVSKKIKIKSVIYLILLVPLLSLIFNYSLCDQSNNYIACDFAKNCLLTPEKNSIVITAGDNDTFPLWYLQEVEHVRSDIKILSIGLIGEPYYQKYLKDRMKLKWDEKFSSLTGKEEFLVNFIQKNRESKIYLTYHGAVKLPPSIGLAPRGILYEVLSSNKKNDLNICSSLFEKTYLLRGLTDKGVYKDLLTSTMMGPYAMGLYELGVLYLDGNMPDKAETIFKIIRKIDYSERKDIKEEFDKALDLQEAKIALINEKYDKALHLLEGEEEFLKNNPTFYLVRGSAYRGKKDYNKALEDITFALKLEPKSAKAYLELGKLYYEEDNIKEAIYKLAIALQMDPTLPTGHYWLGRVYAKCNLKEKAIEEYGKELDLYNNYTPATEGIKEILKKE